MADASMDLNVFVGKPLEVQVSTRYARGFARRHRP